MSVKNKRRKRWNGVHNSTIDLREYMPPIWRSMFDVFSANLGIGFTEQMEDASQCPCKVKVKARKRK